MMADIRAIKTGMVMRPGYPPCGRDTLCAKVNTLDADESQIACEQCMIAQKRPMPDRILSPFTGLYARLARMVTADQTILPQWRGMGIIDLRDVEIVGAWIRGGL